MEDLVPLFAVAMPFIMVIAVVVVPLWLKSRDRREMQLTLRAAIEKGQPLPPEVIEAMTAQSEKKPPTAQSDLRAGMIWFAVGLAVAAFAGVLSIVEPEPVYPLIGLAALPTLIGLTFIVLSFLNPNKADKPKTPA